MACRLGFLVQDYNRPRLVRFRAVLRMLRRFSGVTVRRVIDRSNALVPEHAHDWPVLSIFVLGRYLNETELGEILIDGPSALLYQAGAAHRNAIGRAGFEQIEIEFDAAWLGQALMPAMPVSRWLGGSSGSEARSLARVFLLEADEERLRAALRQFVQSAGRQSVREAPTWVQVIHRRLHDDTTVGIRDLAREVGRHPSWLGTAYRKATGEGPMETAARFRVERAARSLRETDGSFASIAHEAGFCDQSHMNRTFRRLLGRTPSEVRDDRTAFRQ
jgi:AraC family transcriptional regulator